MEVLVTGAFGNIGESTLLALTETHHTIKCFDLRTKATEKKMEALQTKLKFKVIWGNITKPESVDNAIQDVGCVIHLAAIIPPGSETNPELAKQVNVEGTRNVIMSAEKMEYKPKLIYASSVSTYGPRGPNQPPVNSDTPQIATDNYTHHKIECESLIKNSSLDWTILRLAAVPPLEMGGSIDPSFFDTPFEQRIEFAHTRDVGKAFATTVDAETTGKVLLIGGGENSQLTYGVFVNSMMVAMGIGKMPAEAFKVPEKDDDWYYTDWMDTEESERLLRYQQHSFDDFLKEMEDGLGKRKYFMRIFGPLIRKMLVRKSPYI